MQALDTEDTERTRRPGEGRPRDDGADSADQDDLDPKALDEIQFYVARLPRRDARVLQLGCGTGRVSVPLAQQCSLLHGLDLSDAMLAICREKIATAGLRPDRIVVEHRDIADFDLGTTFDLIIAPFRVLQNLETDEQLDGLFRCIRCQLAPEGRSILNVFQPFKPRDELLRTWVREEKLAWEVERGEEMLEEVVLPIPMRVFYPDGFLDLIRSAGFTITGQWGGYAGEICEQGRELVVEFSG